MPGLVLVPAVPSWRMRAQNTRRATGVKVNIAENVYGVSTLFSLKVH